MFLITNKVSKVTITVSRTEGICHRELFFGRSGSRNVHGEVGEGAVSQGRRQRSPPGKKMEESSWGGEAMILKRESVSGEKECS